MTTLTWLELSWKALVLRGGVAIVFGILAVVWPLETVTALAFLWGFWALFDGIGSIMQAFQPETTGRQRALLILIGLVALVVAFFAIFSPAVTAATLIWLLGIWLIVRALMEAILAFTTAGSGSRGVLLFSAALDLVLGVLFVAYPDKSLVGIGFVLGLVAIAWGVVFLVGGLMIRRAAQAEAAGTAP
jgi:uncharacterized membrane protein HdeD (DUF308 family)